MVLHEACQCRQAAGLLQGEGLRVEALVQGRVAVRCGDRARCCLLAAAAAVAVAMTRVVVPWGVRVVMLVL